MKEEQIDKFVNKKVELIFGSFPYTGKLYKIVNYIAYQDGAICHHNIKSGYFLDFDGISGGLFRAADIKYIREVE